MDPLRLETDARGVAVLTLAAGARHNVLSAAMIAALTRAAAQLAHDDNVRAVVLSAEGRSFCAGGDLGWMRDQMAADAVTRRAAAMSLAHMLQALNTLPKPLIARVQGDAFGGGVGLISVCDVVIAADHARFGMTETRLGLIPATIGPYVMARMGEAHARRVFLSSRRFDAQEARDLGIVAQVVPADGLDAAVAAEIASCLECAPGAVALTKQMVRDLGPVIDAAVIDHTVEALIAQWDSDEAAEGLTAFFEKRSPRWAEP